jgi:hypothetical protein
VQDIQRSTLALLATLLLITGCTTLSDEALDPTFEANMEAAKEYNVWQASHNESAADALKPVWNGEQAIRLTYRIDAGQLGTPLAISCVQAQQVAYQEVAPSPLAERSIGVVDVQYPHPAGREGMALVGVVIQQQQTGKRGFTPDFLQHALGWFDQPDEDTIVGSKRDLHEAWVMDVPRGEVAQLIGVLQASGFYGEAEQRRGHVRVTSRVGASYVTKDWSAVSEFDRLMHRVRSQGQLVSYQGIGMPLDQRPSAPASVAAWRSMHEAGQTTGAISSQQLAEQGGQPGAGPLFGAPHQSPSAPQVARQPESGMIR